MPKEDIGTSCVVDESYFFVVDENVGCGIASSYC
jgi:hypothetical protein